MISVNLRQKAKHYKKLYEKYDPKKPYPVIIKSERELEHIRAKVSINMNEIYYAKYAPKLAVYNQQSKLLEELAPFIRKHIKQETDKFSGNIIYSVDVWL